MLELECRRKRGPRPKGRRGTGARPRASVEALALASMFIEVTDDEVERDVNEGSGLDGAVVEERSESASVPARISRMGTASSASSATSKWGGVGRPWA